MKKVRIWNYLNSYTKLNIIKWKLFFIFVTPVLFILATIYTILFLTWLAPFGYATMGLIKAQIETFQGFSRYFKKTIFEFVFHIKCKKCKSVCSEEWKTKGDPDILDKYKEYFREYFIEECRYCGSKEIR